MYYFISIIFYKRTFDIILNGAEKIITVSEAEIIFAMKLIWERMKIV